MMPNESLRPIMNHSVDLQGLKMVVVFNETVDKRLGFGTGVSDADCCPIDEELDEVLWIDFLRQ
jgi:hypothetical protein